MILIGSNPRIESPVFNARIRRAWLNGAEIYLIGKKVDLTYEYTHLGDDRQALKNLLQKNKLTLNSKTFLVVGQGALTDDDGDMVLQASKKISETFSCKFFILHTAASRVGSMEVGFTSDGGIEASLRDAEVIFNLGMDEYDLPTNSFVIYQGSHGDRGANRADIIFPSACYTEESGIFVNTEGRSQLALRANFPPGISKENWAIIRALAGKLNLDLEFDSFVELRVKMIKEFPRLGQLNQFKRPLWTKSSFEDFKHNLKFYPYYSNFYKTNPVARASLIMNDLSKLSDDESHVVAAE